MADTAIPTGAVAVVPDGTNLVQAEVQNIGHYAKTIGYVAVAVLIAVVTVLQSAVDFNWVLIINAGIAGVTALGVYAAPKEAWVKAWITAISAGLQALVLIAPAGLGWDSWSSITPSQWGSVLLTLLGGFGVWVLPNTAKTTVKLMTSATPAPIADGITVGVPSVPEHVVAAATASAPAPLQDYPPIATSLDPAK